MKRYIPAVLFSSLLVGGITIGCSTDQSGQVSSSASAPAAAATPVPGYVSRSMLGDDWPFTCEDGVIGCADSDCVVFTTNGVTYAVNGTAREPGKLAAHGWKDLNTSGLWADDPAYKGKKKSIGSIIDRGLDICKSQ